MNVLISSAVAALLGLSWLAYKQHAVYARLVPTLIIMFLLIYFVTIVWDASVTRTYMKLLPYFSTEKVLQVQARLAKESLLIWNSWVPLALIGSNAYLALLFWGMPWLLRDGRTPGS